MSFGQKTTTIFYSGQHWKHRRLYLGGDIYGKYSELVNRYTITVLNDYDIVELVNKLALNLNGLLRISVDAYYSTISETPIFDKKGTQIDTAVKRGIIYPNTWGSVNDTELLVDQNALTELLGQIGKGSFEASLLRNTFHRRDVFTQSNVRLNRILAFQLICTTFPPSWIHQ